MMRLAAAVCATLALGACSTTVGKGATATASMTRHGFGDAMSAPLKDFNLIRAKVPPVLARAALDPYKRPERVDCPFLEHSVAQLDLALGPDADVPREAGRPTMMGRGSRAASDAALDAVRDLTTGWIPFRSTVRRLTGAAGNEDEVEDAVHAGSLRRAYLKGVGLQQGCAHPARPLSDPMPRTVIAAQTPEAANASAGVGPPAQAADAPVQAAPVSTAVEVAPGV